MLVRVVAFGGVERVRAQEQEDVRGFTDFGEREQECFAIYAGGWSGRNQLSERLQRVRGAVGFDEEFEAGGMLRRFKPAVGQGREPARLERVDCLAKGEVNELVGWPVEGLQRQVE